MFNNLKIIFMGNNDILAFNDIVAGLFNSYRITSNNTIHKIENRKLTDDETDDFIDNLNETCQKEVDNTTVTPEEIETTLNKIVKICPEVKYQIHGIKTALAAKTKKERKEQIEKLDKTKKERESRETQEKESGKRKQYEEEINKRVTERMEKEAAEKEGRKKIRDEEMAKQETEEKKKQETTKKLEDIDKKEEELKKKVGKTNPFTGFKGLMFNFFDWLEDPEKKKSRKEIQKRLRKEWPLFKKNQKILEQNEDLVEDLSRLVEKGKITPESISLFNELIAREPEIVKKFDLSDDTPEDSKVLISLNKLKKEIRDIDFNEKSEILEEIITKYVMKKDASVKFKQIKVDHNINKQQNRFVSIILKDWESFFSVCNILNTDSDDLR